MATFEEFYKSIETDKSGKKFEKFVKWFLKNEPMWKLIVDEIWLWDEYPDRWSRDKGIDLVFKDKQAGIWAVQAKQYDSNTYISKPDVDSFLSESGKQNIKGRLLIASTNAIGTNAMEVITNENTFPPVKTFLLSDFNKAYQEGFEFPLNMAELKSTKKRTILDKNKKFQSDAVEATLEGFKSADRGQLIMACGTGKTIVTLFIKEQIKSNLTMVMLPSLLLVSNTLRKWTSFTEEEFEFLCVCSDKKVAKMVDSEDDDISLNEISLVSNDPEEIKNFINLKTHRVIFCTYQSSPLIAEVYKDKNIPSFDLVVCDEAHRTTGVIKKETAFTTILDEGLIRAHKRLFVTATPRFFSSKLKKKAEDGGSEAIDMNDENIYGRVFFEYSFGQAIEEEELSDYQVLITGVNEKLYKDMIDSRSLIKTKLNNRTDSKSYALQLAVLKGIKKYNLNKLISFHGRKKNAENFSKEIRQTSYELSNESKLEGDFLTGYVDGSMPTFLREKEIINLENVNSSDCYLLSNAKCLSEGVDIPTLDGIVFVDPRESEIDIIQAVGRAIRKSKNKTKGTIILPIFIKKDENSKDEIQKSDFKKIWKIINALKAHDYKLGEVLSGFRNQLGRKGKKYISKSIPKFIFELPKDIDDSFERSLQTRLIEVSTENWYFWLGLLEKYVSLNKNSIVPIRYITEEGYNLGKWVSHQRNNYKNKMLSKEKIALLETIKGWSWDALDHKFNLGIDQLEKYINQNNSSLVPLSYKTKEGYLLGKFVSRWRHNYKYRKKLYPDTYFNTLQKLQGWVWDVDDYRFLRGIKELKIFFNQNKHLNIPIGYEIKGFNLYIWVSAYRQLFKKKKLSKIQIKKLEEIPEWSWYKMDDKFNSFLISYEKYINKNKSTNVPLRYVDDNGYKLGSKFSYWKKLYINNQLDTEKYKKLEKYIKEKKNNFDLRFDKGLQSLQIYYKENEHIKVPFKYKDKNNFPLGRWIRYVKKYFSTLNKNKVLIHKDKIKVLESFKGWSWETEKNIFFNRGIKYFDAYVKKNNSTKILTTHITEDGYALGKWVSRVREYYNKNKLQSYQINILESYKGWVWKTNRWINK